MRDKRRLSGEQHGYLWEDGVHFEARLETPANAYWYSSGQ
jgi:hypothetical protein